MKYRVILLVLLLAACAGQTTGQRYFELKSNYAVALHGAAEYRQACDAKPDDVCRGIVVKLQASNKLASAAFAVADKAILSSDTAWHSRAIASATAALTNLQAILGGAR